MDPVSAGIAAGGQLVGGLIGASSAKHESRQNRREARRQFNNAVQIRVQDALKAGINPLAALGYSGSSPTIHAGGSSGAGEIMGSAIGNASKYLAKAFEEKQVDDMNFDSESKSLDLEGKRIENQILQKRLEQMGSSPGVSEEQPRMLGQDMLFKPVYDLQGRPRLVVNQNVMEGDADNPGYMSSILTSIADGITNGQINPVTGRITDDQLRMMLDDFYFDMTGNRIMNLEELYISPSEAAAATAYMARGVS